MISNGDNDISVNIDKYGSNVSIKNRNVDDKMVKQKELELEQSNNDLKR